MNIDIRTFYNLYGFRPAYQDENELIALINLSLIKSFPPYMHACI
jgi:hypothetical protein